VWHTPSHNNDLHRWKIARKEQRKGRRERIACRGRRRKRVYRSEKSTDNRVSQSSHFAPRASAELFSCRSNPESLQCQKEFLRLTKQPIAPIRKATLSRGRHSGLASPVSVNAALTLTAKDDRFPDDTWKQLLRRSYYALREYSSESSDSPVSRGIFPYVRDAFLSLMSLSSQPILCLACTYVKLILGVIWRLP
jgi:hypothetical protein